MDNCCTKRDLEGSAYIFLLGAAFASAFSMPTGRSFLSISLFLLLVHLFKVRKTLLLPVSFWFWLVFVIVAVFSTAFGLNPEEGFKKMEKLMWFVGIPICATLVTSLQRLSSVLAAYAMGTGVEALRTIVIHPIQAIKAVNTGRMPDFMFALIDRGSMTYAQVLMLGILVVLGFIFICRMEKRSSVKWWILLFIQIIAMVMMFKRGSWVCTSLMVAIFLAVKTNWRYLLVLAIVVMASFILPPVRARLMNLEKEFNVNGGGRMTMWFKIMPALVKEHPFGIGYRALTPEMMRKICKKVERNRNHLHSNIAQILVETGWLGLAVYLLWMGKIMFDGIMMARFARGRAPDELVYAMILVLMIAGLFANGLVEYNFGDAEIVLAYGLVMGCIAAFPRIISKSAISPCSS
ncbi:MAG: O-antigen ligase family protein [Kiritimatiellae bacterium]|nr:O-antigen ligase family protein [Kiritimatiellia bacterium]MDD5522336.1 O-antigen ligase family protein [Kiritimatiellia bacterium]